MHPGASVYRGKLRRHKAPRLRGLVQVAVHDDGIGFGFAVQPGAAGSAAKHQRGGWGSFELLGIQKHHQVFAGRIGVAQVEPHG